MEESIEDVLVVSAKKRQKNKECLGRPPALVPKKKLAPGGLRRPLVACSRGLAGSATTQSM